VQPGLDDATITGENALQDLWIARAALVLLRADTAATSRPSSSKSAALVIVSPASTPKIRALCTNGDSEKPALRTTQIKAYYKAEIQLFAANETAGMS
jgi:hypothetical protein